MNEPIGLALNNILNDNKADIFTCKFKDCFVKLENMEINDFEEFKSLLSESIDFIVNFLGDKSDVSICFLYFKDKLNKELDFIINSDPNKWRDKTIELIKMLNMLCPSLPDEKSYYDKYVKLVDKQRKNQLITKYDNPLAWDANEPPIDVRSLRNKVLSLGSDEHIYDISQIVIKNEQKQQNSEYISIDLSQCSKVTLILLRNYLKSIERNA